MFLVFWPRGIIAPGPRIRPISPAWEGEVLTTAMPGKSLKYSSEDDVFAPSKKFIGFRELLWWFRQ